MAIVNRIINIKYGYRLEILNKPKTKKKKSERPKHQHIQSLPTPMSLSKKTHRGYHVKERWKKEKKISNFATREKQKQRERKIRSKYSV